MKAFSAEITIGETVWIGAGHPPFQVHPAGDKAWMVTGRDGENCIAYPRDGLRAVFDDEQPANLLCQELNLRAGR